MAWRAGLRTGDFLIEVTSGCFCNIMMSVKSNLTEVNQAQKEECLHQAASTKNRLGGVNIYQLSHAMYFNKLTLLGRNKFSR